jgi:bacterioferritin-associated ferredoxin
MYVCICNSLTERTVRELAASPSIRTVEDLFAAMDVEPVCGHCMDFAEEIIVETGQKYRAHRDDRKVVNGCQVGTCQCSDHVAADSRAAPQLRQVNAR